jgi:hypothetical protein
MTLFDLQSCLDRLGVKLSARGDRLHFQAPAGALTPEIKAALVLHKPALLARLEKEASPTRPSSAQDVGVKSGPAIAPESAEAEAVEQSAPAEPPALPETAADEPSGLADGKPGLETATPDLPADSPALAVAGPPPNHDGPRDFRRGDRWLSWHHVSESPGQET